MRLAARRNEGPLHRDRGPLWVSLRRHPPKPPYQPLTFTKSAFSGVFITLIAQPVVRMGSVGDVGMRVGMVLTIESFGALAGPPISGAILDHTGGFKAVGYYAGALRTLNGSACGRANGVRVSSIGSTIMLAVALLVVVRQLVLRKMVGNA